MTSSRRKRLMVLMSHPIQYYSPWFRELDKLLDLYVLYAHKQDSKGQAQAGFGVEFDWDIPLLEGYRYSFLRNVARKPTVQSFWGLNTPSVLEEVRRFRPALLLVGGWNRWSYWQAIYAAKRFGAKIAVRTDSQSKRSRNLVQSMAMSTARLLMLRVPDVFLAAGSSSAKYLTKHGVPNDRVSVLHHFVDRRRFHPPETEKAELRSALGLPSRALTLLFVGKLIEKKRPLDILLAVAATDLDSSDVTVLYVGEGPLREDLATLAKKNKLNVHFAGFVNQSSLPAFYGASDLLVLPSDERETWGLVAAEAMACGTPVIVSNLAGCAKDLVGLPGTFTYRCGDVHSLANEITLCASKLQNQSINSIAEAASLFDAQHAARKLEKIVQVSTSQA